MATEISSKQSNGAVNQLKSQTPHEPRIVVTTLNYYDDPGDGTPPAPVIVGGTTVKNERAAIPTRVTVTDISKDEDKYNLDNFGFQLVHHQAKTSCVEDGYRELEKLKSEYFPECEQLLKDVTGANRTYIFDHKVRRGAANWHQLGPNNASKRGPLHRVHVDQSYYGAEFLVKRFMKDEADELLKKRWQIINVWRPIRTIYRDPLAVADANSIAESDLVAAKVIYPDHQRETWTVKPNSAHKWFFKNEQKPDEVMFIKCFDSVQSVARRVPHSAFHDPEHDDKDARESIEIRALVFYTE